MQVKKKRVPIDGKRHHTNQSQSYIANYVMWLLRNRGSIGRDSGERLTAAVTVIETAIEITRFVTFSLCGVYSLMYHVVFGVVCSVVVVL